MMVGGGRDPLTSHNTRYSLPAIRGCSGPVTSTDNAGTERGRNVEVMYLRETWLTVSCFWWKVCGVRDGGCGDGKVCVCWGSGV